MNTGFKPTVAVDGATGYLGSHLVADLRNHGFPVRAIVHSGARQQDVDFLRSQGAEVVVADLNPDNTQLIEALSECSVAVHLIGSIAPKRGERLEDLHGAQAANLVAAARKAGVHKVVQVTALGTDANAHSSYHQTKWQAEEIVRNSGMRWVILRPSLIIGKQVGRRNSKLVTRYTELIRTRPSVPVIGGGNNKVQPVFIGDLVAALRLVIETEAFDGKTLEIGGPEVITMKQFVETLIKALGANKRVTGVPTFAANIVATCCEAIQNVPLLTRDQIKISSEDNVCTQNALPELGVPLTSVVNALSTYAPSKQEHALT